MGTTTEVQRGMIKLNESSGCAPMAYIAQVKTMTHSRISMN